MHQARRFGVPALGFGGVDESGESTRFDQAVGAHGLQHDGGGVCDVFVQEVVLTVVVDEAGGVDISACGWTDDGFVLGLEGPCGIGGGCDADTASWFGFWFTSDYGRVVHDEVAFGRLNDVGGPDGSVFAFGGPGTDVWEGRMVQKGPVLEIGGCRYGDYVFFCLGCVGVVGVVYFDDGGVGEDG